jgi:hypothetical protein
MSLVDVEMRQQETVLPDNTVRIPREGGGFHIQSLTKSPKLLTQIPVAMQYYSVNFNISASKSSDY